jgi:hypothetical protein
MLEERPIWSVARRRTVSLNPEGKLRGPENTCHVPFSIVSIEESLSLSKDEADKVQFAEVHIPFLYPVVSVVSWGGDESIRNEKLNQF